MDSAQSLATRTSIGRSGSPPSFPMSSSSSLDDSRFLAGTMLAGRYRIVGLLGRGGMGEVYRADDLTLGQTVALKFLPQGLEQDEALLARFFNEVRTARQVSHPNVCRIHDVGELEGQVFLSMEYVDGEDLATLLRRIGRLPEDKAVQIARQLCAGLAAAHDRGIVHRDLKPANVMLDGEGRVRITDFGLAGLADAIEGAEVRVGTPAYMAPEQLDGSEVTLKSDLYSLGLVLYELFTGKPAFDAKTPAELRKLQAETTPTSPSSVIEGLDASVERVILRCLEKTPADRPSTALSVAAALPGGDPLAAALAAGETPSPEMVAAAGPQGGLRPVVGLACMAIVIAGIAATALLAPSGRIHERFPMEKSMEALRENARSMVSELGYTEPAVDSDAAFVLDFEQFVRLTRKEGAGAWDALSHPGQTILTFRYRQAPRHLVPSGLDGQIGAVDPWPGPGDIRLHLDLAGRLVFLRARPELVEITTEPPPPVDWESLFQLAGLEIDEFEPTSPTMQPAVFTDSRMAWTGRLPRNGDLPVRIEAAGCRGKPVYFEQVLPHNWYWSVETVATEEATPLKRPAFFTFMVVVGAILATGAVFLAVRNLRVGRGDRKGAMRLATAVFTLMMLQWLWSGHHLAELGEFWLLVIRLGLAMSVALFAWVFYVALEPYVRRLWPEGLVGWSRLLAGRFRDPLVGRDLLVGSTIGIGLAIYTQLFVIFLEPLGIPPYPDDDTLGAFRGGRHLVGSLFKAGLSGLSSPLIHLVMFLLLRIVLRKQWLAATAYCLLWASFSSTQFVSLVASEARGTTIAFGFCVGLIYSGVIATLLVRFGLLATVAAFICLTLLRIYPVTADVSAPYFAGSLFGMVAVVALAVYGYYHSLAGQPFFRDAILRD